MTELTKHAKGLVARGLGAYLRAVPQNELPGALRRFASFTPKALTPHADRLVGSLERDAELRARVVDWLQDGKPRMNRREERALRVFCERPDGWKQELSSLVDASARSAPRKPDESRWRERADRERQKARRARDEAQRAKEETRRRDDQHRKRATELERRVGDLEAALERKNGEVEQLLEELKWATATLERERRKAGKAAERAAQERERLVAEKREAAREVRTLRARVAALEKRPATKAPLRKKPGPPARRKALRAPKGLLADAPETLDAWLDEPDVHLLVDGYNVTKARGGFGNLKLESQRERLIDELARLARRKQTKTTIVFDGAEVPAGTRRRPRSPVAVEYSKPTETGDDHIVARLDRLPPYPVVVVTNDKELQGRAARHGATIATSNQLLGLIR